MLDANLFRGSGVAFSGRFPGGGSEWEQVHCRAGRGGLTTVATRRGVAPAAPRHRSGVGTARCAVRAAFSGATPTKPEVETSGAPGRDHRVTVLNVGDRHSSAFGRTAQRDGAPDSRCATGDDRSFALHKSHDVSNACAVAPPSGCGVRGLGRSVRTSVPGCQCGILRRASGPRVKPTAVECRYSAVDNPMRLPDI